MTREEILSIAPDQELVNLRKERYRGGALSLTLQTNFSDDEGELVRRQYDLLKQLLALTEVRDADATQRQTLEDFLRNRELPALQDQLLSALEDREDDPQMQKALYELASGAYASICGYCMLIPVAGLEPGYRQALYYLTRDHLKVMRAVVADLDPAIRARDEKERHHSVELLLEKWRSASYRAFDRVIEVRFDNHFDGNVAERCLEFAELDNLFYHLANNCVKYSSDQMLDIGVVPTGDGRSLRWTFSNAVSDGQQDAIHRIRGRGISLFERGSTTADSRGLGLGIVADSVMHAYGLDDLYDAESKGYFGTVADQKRFAVWFHWPSVPGEV